MDQETEFHKAMIECSPVAIYSLDKADCVRTWNESAERLLGWTAAEVIGRPIPMTLENRRGEEIALRGRLLEGQKIVGWEVVCQRKDGRRFDASLSAAPLYSDGRRWIGMTGAVVDISERKTAEESLRRSETLLKTAQHIGKIGGWEWNLDTQEMYWTEETYRIHDMDFGGSRAESQAYIDKSVSCYADEDRERILTAFRECVSDGKAYEMECRFVSAKGRRLWIRTAGQAVLDGDRIVRVVGHIQDITEMKKSEEILNYQTRLLKDMGRIAKIGGWEFDPETGDGSWTEEVAMIHDLDKNAPTSRDIGLSHYEGDSLDRVQTAIREAVEHQRPYDIELELTTAKNRQKWIRVIGRPRVRDQKVVQLYGAVQDITGHKYKDLRLLHLNRVLLTIQDVTREIRRGRDAQAMIAACAEAMVKNGAFTSAIVILTGPSGRPIHWAGSGSAVLSEALDEAMIKGEIPPCCDPDLEGGTLLGPDSRKFVCSRCPFEEKPHGESTCLCVPLRHEATDFGYLVAAQPRTVTVSDTEGSRLFGQMAADMAMALKVFVIDADHRAAEAQKAVLERQLVQAQKMESIGNLAGGVAHDFNNILNVIIGYSELTMERMPADDPLRTNIKHILDAALRSADITRQLLAFARQQAIEPRLVDLNKIVKDMMKMLKRLIGEEITLTRNPGRDLWPVMMDVSQLNQILVNLCVNARDAIGGVGEITIDTDMICFDEEYCMSNEGFIQGEFVMLAVGDDGCGMEKETLERIFEPFFTTKGPGHGTGLGLSTVYGIVKQNDGFIHAYSEPGNGTVFRIYFPRHAGIQADDRPDTPFASPTGRGEAVLLVEDDAAIMEMVRLMLTELGYVVFGAETPDKALKMVERDSLLISLVLTDVVMPGMNGRELVEQIKGVCPSAKSLFMSGYTADVITKRGVIDDNLNFIAKPFSKLALATKIREILDEG